MIKFILGCSPAAFSVGPELSRLDLIYYYKLCEPDCIDLDSDSDATDINELCDDLANNPGVVGLYTSHLSPSNDAVICLSSDEEVEVDQEWVKRVSGRSSSPVPISLQNNAVSPISFQEPKEQLPMVFLPASIRKSLCEDFETTEEPSRSSSNEDISEPAKETTKDDNGYISKCFVKVNKLSQEEIDSFLKVNNKIEDKVETRAQDEIKRLCDSDDSEYDKPSMKYQKQIRDFETDLECSMKTPMKMTIRRKSTDSRRNAYDSDNLFDKNYTYTSQLAKKRKIMIRRHSVHESKADVSKEITIEAEQIKLPTTNVPKRRASMNISVEDFKKKLFKPDRAIKIQALPNKQLRQRSNYNEKSTTPSIEKSTNTITSSEKLKKVRNEKIREIAQNQQNKVPVPSTSQCVKTVTKPVAKMTLNNRGSFLTENIALQRNAPSTSKALSKTTIVRNAPKNSNSNDIKITIEQFRNSHLNANTPASENESQGVCNNVQFYENIRSSCENKKIQQRKLTITLDDEELQHQRRLQQSASTSFYTEVPVKPPTYSSVQELRPYINQTIFHISPRASDIQCETPTNKKVELKSILTPVSSTKKSDKRVSFNKVLFSVREIPKINQDAIDDEETLITHFNVPTETVEPIEKILFEILTWCPSWLERKRGDNNRPKKWKFRPMLQSYESLDQYKQILNPIMNMEILSNVESKYVNLINANKEKWSTLNVIFCSKLSASLFCIQVTGELKDSRKNYSVGTLIIVKVCDKLKETKFFGYISEQIDRNNFMIQCGIDEINYSWASNANKVDILPIMYLRSELKSLLSLNQVTETEIMMKILQPELNKPVVTVIPDTDGLVNLNPSQSEISCRIVEDLLNDKEAKVIALQGGPGTGKTKVIVACVMKIIRKSNCKILICSKSNTCINEITVHLNSLSIENRFQLVRFGNQERISKEVMQVSLNQLANQYLNNTTENNNFQRAKMAVIQMADVVCTTINSSYDLINEYKKHFDVCFIDEASQFTDSDLMIPVLSGFRKLVLIGDPKQLQPNVNAKELKNLNFEVSLLERMVKICDSKTKKNPVLTLTIQHRMNPEIFKFPNQYFYDNKISTSLSKLPSIALKPYMVFGLKYDQNMTQDMSCYNTGEIKFCYHLCESLLTILPPNLTIAIITPYLRQRDEVLKYFK